MQTSLDYECVCIMGEQIGLAAQYCAKMIANKIQNVSPCVC